MGAHNFETTLYTDLDMQTAYKQAVEDALHEDGHEPYNGTISTTEGVVRSPLHDGTPIPEDQIDMQAVMGRLDHLDKWGHCEALPIYKVIPRQTKTLGTVTYEVAIPSDLATATPHDPQLRHALTTAAMKELRKRIRADRQITLDPNYRGASAVVNTGTAVDDYDVDYFAHQIAQEPKVTTRATKGKTETRYFILPANGTNQMPGWETGYPTQADARAALPTSLPARRGWDQKPHAEYEVISMTRRVGGDPLVTHTLDATTRKTTRVKVSVRVVEVIEPAQMTRQKGWLFYGWAAS